MSGVPFPLRNLHCDSGRKPSASDESKTHAKIFPGMDKIEIFLWLLHSRRSPFLKMMTSLTSF